MLLTNTPWLIFALSAAVSIAGVNIVLKQGAGLMDPVLFIGIAFTAAWVFAMGVLFFYTRGQDIGPISAWPPKGILFGVLAGLCAVLIELSIVFMFARQAPLGVSIPVVQATALSLTLIFSVLLLKEKFEMINILGLALAFVAIPLMLYRSG